MAVENFLHDGEGISSTIQTMRENLDAYKEQVAALEQVVNNMNSSSSWKDEQVKTSYIATVTSYISAYKNFSSGIEGLINSLTKKSENITEHESMFS